MPPRSILCLREVAASGRFQQYYFELCSRRRISQYNLVLPRTLLYTSPRLGDPAILRSNKHLRSQTAHRHHPPSPSPSRPRSFTTTSATKMASDEDYMAFLDKANQDPNEGQAKPQSKSNEGFKATDDGAQIPAAIQNATKDAFYVSDADEPFVPVCLAWDEGGKGLPDEEEFATLIHHPDPSKAEIEIQDPTDWDTQGQYGGIIDAVTKAGKGNDVRVYRIVKGGVKVEYWVVTTEGKGADAKLVGAKALAVES
ncbi:hypothetical protein F4860DRAFT_461530 [Xylaria cubensis]|nr:hypothetical protein F4860DRAFT_461530 [Xylaria cubensis]